MRRGFTLVEVLGTTALAALLLLAAFKVTASLARGQRAVLAQQGADTATPQVLELLRWDLSNARFIRARPGELSLIGYGKLDPRDRSPGHRSVHVVYRLRSAAGQRWLVREQTMLGRGGRRSTQLVCSGVRDFRVERVARRGRDPTEAPEDADAAAEPDPSDSVAAPTGNASQPPRGHDLVPDRLRLIVKADGALGVRADELVFLR